MKERERERSRERHTDRSPLGRRGELACDLHPRRQNREQVLITENIPQEQESKLDEDFSQQVPETPEIKLVGEQQNAAEEGTRKEQKTIGAFTGLELLKVRDEPWMSEDIPLEQPIRHKVLSYSEALKVNNTFDDGNTDSESKEESWDGNLFSNGEEEMKKGVTIRDTEEGFLIDFLEEERRRLELKWTNSLFIKLLGGTIGFMQLRRKV